MNRKERREIEKSTGAKLPKSKVYTLTEEQIELIKEEERKKAVDTSFKLLLCIPVMVIHDYYSKLMRKETDGKKREEIMADLVLDLYDSFERGFITLSELEDCLYEETGMRFEEEYRNRRKL